jgi:HEPN domain-containing protein
MTKQWFVFAGRDLRAAKAILELGSEYKNICAFNCQQCVEKAIKGFLVYSDVRPPKSHNISDLIKLVLKIDPALGKSLSKTEVLTKYAVAYRYPDSEVKPLTMIKVKSALKMAKTAYDSCFERVRK